MWWIFHRLSACIRHMKAITNDRKRIDIPLLLRRSPSCCSLLSLAAWNIEKKSCFEILEADAQFIVSATDCSFLSPQTHIYECFPLLPDKFFPLLSTKIQYKGGVWCHFARDQYMLDHYKLKVMKLNLTVGKTAARSCDKNQGGLWPCASWRSPPSACELMRGFLVLFLDPWSCSRAWVEERKSQRGEEKREAGWWGGDGKEVEMERMGREEEMKVKEVVGICIREEITGWGWGLVEVPMRSSTAAA